MEMDVIKQLTIELDGIEKVLKIYSDGCAAVNVIPKLREALKENDKESIIYCLSVIDKWYSDNIYEIMNNGFAFNEEEHKRNQKLVNSLLQKIQAYDFSKIQISSSNAIEKQEESNVLAPVIFLSHKSSDKKYGDILEEFFMGIGLKKEQLIYTSHPLHKIPLDANIYDYLRKNINRKIFMIILWSNEYLESPACLNEMGAAWVVQCDYTNMYVPSFSFGNPKYHECAVDTRKMGAVLKGDEHCKQSMLELKDKLTNMFNLEIDEKNITYLLDKMMEQLKELQK